MASSAVDLSPPSTPLSDEDDVAIQQMKRCTPFRFLDLPAELRREVLDRILVRESPIDIDVKVHRDLSRLSLVSKQFHDEAASSFYGGNTFRILPTHPRAAGKYARPLLQDFSPSLRSRIVSLELRLGPFWSDPPKCWRRGITKRLGLEQVTSLRTLRVFIEIDPSHPIFNGFRSTKIVYHEFCAGLLEQILRRLPNLEEVHFDAYFSASRGMVLIDTLVELAKSHDKRISWGPYQRAIDKERERSVSNPDPSLTFAVGMLSNPYSTTAKQQSLPKSLLV